MNKNILPAMIVTGLVVILISACGTDSMPPPIDPLTDGNQPEIQAISTVKAVTTATANDSSAHDFLVQFLDYLYTGRYDEAVSMYGGDYQVMIDQNPTIDPADNVALMKSACTTNGFQCLQLKVAGIEYKPSPNEYLFTVQFQNDDGSLFKLGPCCGASETEQASISFFEIRVLKNADGKFRVLDMPPYMP